MNLSKFGQIMIKCKIKRKTAQNRKKRKNDPKTAMNDLQMA